MAASGYECEFVESVQEFECPLCLHVTREPHLTSCCGQDFCQNCINRVLTDNKPCPLCKAHPFTVMLNKKERRRVLALKVYCSMKDRGCSWIGELCDLDSHLGTRNASCQYVDVPCTNNCGRTFQRRLLHKHLSELCPKRDFSCKYCGYKATFKDVSNKHMPVCTKYPLPCPNDCDIGTVERGSLKKHLSECPLQLVQCEFSHLGCSEKIQRKDLPKHMEENTQKHLVMMSATLGRIMDMNTQLETKLQQSERRLERRLAEKDEQIEQLRTRLLKIDRGALLPPVEFNIHNFSQYEGQGKRWNQCPPFYTHFQGAKIKIALLMYVMCGDVGIYLCQEPGEFDGAIDWPVWCTVTVQILNQERNEDHLEYSMDYALCRQTVEYTVQPVIVRICYFTLRLTQHDIQYIKDDCLHMRADVTLKCI